MLKKTIDKLQKVCYILVELKKELRIRKFVKGGMIMSGIMSQQDIIMQMYINELRKCKKIFLNVQTI